jgi:branched-chain amino acid transport system ATP-binding protein
MGLLDARGVRVAYGAVVALRDVTVTVEQGQIVVLIGPNGAGKSTLIRSILALVPAIGGEVWFRGKCLNGLGVHQRARRGISLVPEGRRVFPNLSVLENLYVGGDRRSRREVEKELEESVRVYFPRLLERRRQLAGTLSGGEQQMLAIARAIMSGAGLMLMDEPSLGLSPLMVSEVKEVAVKLNREKGLSILMVEQNARLGLEMADYIYLLDGGEVRLEGPSAVVSKSEEVIRSYIGV